MPAQLAMAFRADPGMAAGREITEKWIGGWRTRLIWFHLGLSYAFQPACVGGRVAAMDHSPGFLKVVEDAQSRVHELTIEQAKARLAANPKAVLVDVREDSEWAKGHAAEAVHLGKGILERDIEKVVPDAGTELIMYCGGGYRSVLTCDVAQRMGYTKVASVIGGYKGMAAAGWKMVQ